MPSEATDTRAEAATEEDTQLRDSLKDLGSLPAELWHLVHDQVQLAALELRLAGRSLVAMISVAIFAGALLLLAWIALLGSAGLGLSALGLAPALIMLILAMLTMALALLLKIYIYRKSKDLEFPSTVRSLKPPAAKTHKTEPR